MGVYDNQVAMAQRLIKAKGQSVTWRSLINGTPPNINEPWKPSSSTYTDHTVKIVFLPANDESIKYLSGMEIPECDTVGLMASVDFAPSLKDIVLRGGNEFTILSISQLAPNGENILYTIGFKS